MQPVVIIRIWPNDSVATDAIGIMQDAGIELESHSFATDRYGENEPSSNAIECKFTVGVPFLKHVQKFREALMRLFGASRVTINIGGLRIDVRHKDDLDKAVEAVTKIAESAAKLPAAIFQPPAPKIESKEGQ